MIRVRAPFPRGVAEAGPTHGRGIAQELIAQELLTSFYFDV